MARKLTRKQAQKRIARINRRPCTVGPFPDGSFVHFNGGVHA